SDHSPAPFALKEGADAFAAWGGISGCQSLLALLLDEVHHRRAVPLERITEVAAGAVARRLRLPRKGRLEVGADADLVLVDLSAPSSRRSARRRRAPRSPGCCPSATGSSTRAGAARQPGSRSATSRSGSASRTSPATPRRARSCSTRAASARPRSSFPTGAAA